MRMGGALRALMTVVLLFVAAPAVVVLIASFSAGPVLSFPPEGISAQSYADLLGDPAIRSALLRSLLVGALAVVFANLIGVPAAIGLFRHRPAGRIPLAALLLLGVATPLITSAFAFLVLYTQTGVVGSLWSLALAISIVNLPFLIFSVASALVQLDPHLEEAAGTLGAETVQTFLFVTLPGLTPGIISGSLTVFVLGITEFLISLLLTTLDSQTLPVVIFGGLRGAVPSTLAAAAGLYVTISVAVVVLIVRLRATSQFLYRAD